MIVRGLLQRRENIIVFNALEVKRAWTARGHPFIMKGTTGFAPPWAGRVPGMGE